MQVGKWQMHKPELLAPAGNWDCAKAAVANGADAIYFGLDCGFNARARAANFHTQDLPALMAFLHRHAVRGYVALNTLAFSEELETLERLIRTIAEAGADAVLIQDIGLAKLIRAVAPKLAIHASTQMTMTSAECIAQIEPLGIERVVLARELSVEDMEAIHSASAMPLEAFVHGALCVAYSGQCLTSESLGGRSANRGQCAQACRMPYELICDNQDVDLGDQQYLLSPQDLAAYALIPDLIRAGVVSLKIEGRLKTPEYVANITRHYRQAIDGAVAGRPVEFSRRDVEEMELSFSRGFSVGWLGGSDHKMLVPATSSSKRGVYCGEVVEVLDRSVRVKLASSLKAGDGIVFEGNRAANAEQGGRIFLIWQRGRRVEGTVDPGVVELAFSPDALQLDQLYRGQKFWKTDDPALTQKWRKTFHCDIPLPTWDVHVQVQAHAGERLRLSVMCPQLATFEVSSTESLAVAMRHPLTIEVLQQQLGRLGATGFRLASVQAEIQGEPMVPLSVLGKLRKELVAQLQEQRENRLQPHAQLASNPVLPRLRREALDLCSSTKPTASTSASLAVLCRSLAQLNAALVQRPDRLYIEFQDIREYGQALEMARAKNIPAYLATPRIQKPGEMGVFRALLKHGADGILVRNLSGLDFFRKQGVDCVADFSLNAANELTVGHLCSLGAQRVTVSYDLNRDQLLTLVRQTAPQVLEVVIHQHVPMFHMEHCVYCAVLSPGTNKTNCGRPCDVHDVKLRDRVGMEHPLRADVGCRNTLYNVVPQSGAEVVHPLLDLGVRSFRIELLEDHSDVEIQHTIQLYQDLLAGRITGTQVWQKLKASNRIGITRGTLEERRNPLAIL